MPVYWYGKNKAASLFGTGPVFGGDANQMIAWLYHGGGQEFYRELTQDILGLNVVGFLSFGMPAQPLGWFKNEITDAAQLKGLKYRTVGLAADLFQAMGAASPSFRAARSCRRWSAASSTASSSTTRPPTCASARQDVAKNYMLVLVPPGRASRSRYIFNRDTFESLDPDLQAILEYGVEAAHLANYALAMNQYSADLQKLQTEAGVNVKRTPDAVLQAQLAAWDKILPPLMEDPFIKKVMDSQKAWCERVVFYSLLNAPDYKLAYKHYFPGKITLTGLTACRAGIAPLRAVLRAESPGGRHGRLHQVRRQSVGVVRQGLRLVHHGDDLRHRLRSLRALRSSARRRPGHSTSATSCTARCS